MAARDKLPVQRREFARECAQQSGLARAVHAENADAVVRIHAQGHVRKHLFGGVAERRPVDREGGVGDFLGVRERETVGRFGMHGGHFVHAFERLQAALRLPRFARLGAEAINELPQVRDVSLLLVVERGLAFERVGALALEGGVVAGVRCRLAVLEMRDLVHHAVEKVPVVGNDEQCALVFAQPRLQPQRRLQIQMVGGFVQEQQIGWRHQRPRQVQANAPTAGEDGVGRLEVLLAESQTA